MLVPQQARAVATRERLLEAAASLLAEEGLRGTTTTAVATRAGVSQGALFKHFPSKTALLSAATQAVLASLVRDFRGGLPKKLPDALEPRIALGVRALWKVFRLPAMQGLFEVYLVDRRWRVVGVFQVGGWWRERLWFGIDDVGRERRARVVVPVDRGVARRRMMRVGGALRRGMVDRLGTSTRDDRRRHERERDEEKREASHECPPGASSASRRQSSERTKSARGRFALDFRRAVAGLRGGEKRALRWRVTRDAGSGVRCVVKVRGEGVTPNEQRRERPKIPRKIERRRGVAQGSRR